MKEFGFRLLIVSVVLSGLSFVVAQGDQDVAAIFAIVGCTFFCVWITLHYPRTLRDKLMDCIGDGNGVFVFVIFVVGVLIITWTPFVVAADRIVVLRLKDGPWEDHPQIYLGWTYILPAVGSIVLLRRARRFRMII